MIGDRWKENLERIMNVDVRMPREFSRTCTQIEREQGRIDWRVRCAENMERMKSRDYVSVDAIH